MTLLPSIFKVNGNFLVMYITDFKFFFLHYDYVIDQSLLIKFIIGVGKISNYILLASNFAVSRRLFIRLRRISPHTIPYYKISLVSEEFLSNCIYYKLPSTEFRGFLRS